MEETEVSLRALQPVGPCRGVPECVGIGALRVGVAGLVEGERAARGWVNPEGLKINSDTSSIDAYINI